jgi:hypothetical protein
MIPHLLSALLGMASIEQGQALACAKEVQATAIASRMSQLPPEIRDDLMLMFKNDLADSGTPILQTHAPSEAERNLPTSRFVQALLVKDIWYVSYEVSMMGSRTIRFGLAQGGPDDPKGFVRKQIYGFGGPPCEAIKASLKGVTAY